MNKSKKKNHYYIALFRTKIISNGDHYSVFEELNDPDRFRIFYGTEK